VSLPAEVDVVIQMGHVARVRGGTGTSGHRGSEQDFVKRLGPMIRDLLLAGGLTVDLIGADDKRRPADVFLALHQDGSRNKSASGASTGFPIHGDGEILVKIWKARYTTAGWPYGFRRSNYTVGEHYYYGFGGLRRWWWKRAKYAAAFLIEHGFATNPDEENWMWDHLPEIAKADADTILQYFKQLPEDHVPTLNLGSRGPFVKTLQQTLNLFDKAGLVEDGIFGNATKRAVMAYQAKLNVRANGIWDSTSADAQKKFVQYLADVKVSKPITKKDLQAVADLLQALILRAS